MRLGKNPIVKQKHPLMRLFCLLLCFLILIFVFYNPPFIQATFFPVAKDSFLHQNADAYIATLPFAEAKTLPISVFTKQFEVHPFCFPSDEDGYFDPTNQEINCVQRPGFYTIEHVRYEKNEDQTVTYHVTARMDYTLGYEPKQVDTFINAVWPIPQFFDYYTGSVLSVSDVLEDDSYTFERDITWKDHSYHIATTMQESIDWGYWDAKEDEDTAYCPTRVTITLSATVPAGYNGLLLGFSKAPMNEENAPSKGAPEAWQAKDLSSLETNKGSQTSLVDDFYFVRIN